MTIKTVVRTLRTRSIYHSAAVLAVIGLLLGMPLWMVFVTAAKSQQEAQSPNLALPTTWHLWENLKQAFTEGDIPAGFFGSLLLIVPTVLGVLFFGSMAAWVLARRQGRLVSILYALAISGIVLPPGVVTVVLLLRNLGLAGTALGMIGVYMGIYMSTVIFFVTGFVRSLPIELEEAARIDGAGPFRVYLQIILPMLSPVLATATILISHYVWSDVFYSFFIIGGRLDTLPLNLFQVASSGMYLNNWNLIFAFIILMSLPLLLIFVFA